MSAAANSEPDPMTGQEMQIEDDGLYDIHFVCAFFGGNKPLHPATVYRGIAAGRYSPPVSPSPNIRRWVGRDLKADKDAIINRARAS